MADLTLDIAIDAVAPADQTALRAWFELEQAAQPVDDPGGAPAYWAAHRARLSAPRPGEDTSAWLARSDDEVVGAGELSLPLLDNTDNALVEIVVHLGTGVGGWDDGCSRIWRTRPVRRAGCA